MKWIYHLMWPPFAAITRSNGGRNFLHILLTSPFFYLQPLFTEALNSSILQCQSLLANIFFDASTFYYQRRLKSDDCEGQNLCWSPTTFVLLWRLKFMLASYNSRVTVEINTHIGLDPTVFGRLWILNSCWSRTTFGWLWRLKFMLASNNFRVTVEVEIHISLYQLSNDCRGQNSYWPPTTFIPVVFLQL